MSEHKFTNALAGEISPYLLQHAHNPVNWYPWTQEALRRAREEDKPILLSIGYSACHWCHVMERESFENEKIAQIMNRHFINIKVDREERPDLDSIYMTAVQMMTGSGGWPMTVFLTPEGVPFYAGTYFPPEDRQGMPAFPRVLLSVAGAYRDKKDLIRNDAARIIEAIRNSDSIGISKGNLDPRVLDTAASNLMADYDARHGGFGSAPKFPPSMALTFLLRSFIRTGRRPLLEAVERTLQKMAHGGIYDQLGGGFHRYSVDAYWLVPHFEKMLYDNALLSRIYLDAFLLTGNPLYRRITEETLDYVFREMTSPEGGFYSSQDADSEGHEGKFFTWKQDEVMQILGRVEGELFCRFYGITPQGNFEGGNILSIPEDGGDKARPGGLSEVQFKGIIEKCRARLFEAREKRVRPGRDEKVLTAWNGLMMRSFAEAACALEREDYREIAVRNAAFLVSNLQRDGRLLRTWKDGQSRLNGYLEDCALLIDGLLSVYEATFDPAWIGEAERIVEFLVGNFWDADSGSFYLTAGDHETLIHRPKDFYDNATPSGNSAAAHALLRLAEFTGNSGWADYARTVLAGTADLQANHPSAFSNYLCALDFLLASPRQIAILGDPAAAETRDLLREIFGRYLPNKVVACGEAEGVFLLKNRIKKEGRTTVYVCRGYVCQAPVTTVEELRDQLNPNFE